MSKKHARKYSREYFGKQQFDAHDMEFNQESVFDTQDIYPNDETEFNFQKLNKKKTTKNNELRRQLIEAYEKSVIIYKPDIIDINFVNNAKNKELLEYYKEMKNTCSTINMIYIIYEDCHEYCTETEMKEAELSIKKWCKIGRYDIDDIDNMYDTLYKIYTMACDIKKYHIINHCFIYNNKKDNNALLKYYIENQNAINIVKDITKYYKPIKSYVGEFELFNIPFSVDAWRNYSLITKEKIKTEEIPRILSSIYENIDINKESYLFTADDLAIMEIENIVKIKEVISKIDEIKKYNLYVMNTETQYPKIGSTKLVDISKLYRAIIDYLYDALYARGDKKKNLTVDYLFDMIKEENFEYLKNVFIRYNSINNVVDIIRKIEKNMNIAEKDISEIEYDEIIKYKNLLEWDYDFKIANDVNVMHSGLKPYISKCICDKCKGTYHDDDNHWDIEYMSLNEGIKNVVKNIIISIRKIYVEKEIAAADPMTFIKKYRGDIRQWLNYLAQVKEEYE